MNKSIIVFTLFLFCSFQSFCFSCTQLLGYVWICKTLHANEPYKNLLLEGGFLDRDNGCHSCNICHYQYSQHPFWKIVWGNAPVHEILQCTCAVNGFAQESALSLDSCPDSALDTGYDCAAGCGVKRIENCNGALTCGDCSKQIKNP